MLFYLNALVINNIIYLGHHLQMIAFRTWPLRKAVVLLSVCFPRNDVTIKPLNIISLWNVAYYDAFDMCCFQTIYEKTGERPTHRASPCGSELDAITQYESDLMVND